MAKSKKRGGKKAHAKRVNKRNAERKIQENNARKQQQQAFDEIMKQYESQIQAQNTEEVLDVDGTVAPNIDQIEGIDGPEI